MYTDLKVLKRDNKKVDFNGEKIAIAIKKAFDSREEFTDKYNDNDINKVYKFVLNDIFDNYFEKAYIKVEDIQDVIEKILIKLDYKDVYESFSSYREKRSESRKMFLSEPKQHKLLKAIEKISTNQERKLKGVEYPLDIIFKYGTIISEEFSNAYLLNHKHLDLHESGQIMIDDIEYISIGTTESCVIDINKIVSKGFFIDNREYKITNDIVLYLEYISLILKRVSEDQHGNQGINNFDYLLSDAIVETFKDEFNNNIYDLFEISGYLNLIDFDQISKEINKIESLVFDLDNIYKYSKDVEQVKTIINKSYSKSIENTNKILQKSLYNFLNNINYKVNNINREITLSIGLNTTYEGRMVTKNLLLALEEFSMIRIVFMIKKGINAKKEDINYDLFELAASTVMKNINLGLLNIDYYKNINFESDIFCFYDGTKLLGNVFNNNSVYGRGFLSKTYINMARLAIKTVEDTKEVFYQELDNILNLVAEQLYDRFLVQSEKRVFDFQFLIGENIYMDSKGLKQGEKIKKSIKNGFLGIGISGLNECVTILNKKVNQKDLLDYLYNKIEDLRKNYNLNFVLIGPDDESSTKFLELDRTIYGDFVDKKNKTQYDTLFNEKYIEDFEKTFDGGIAFIKYVNNEKDILSILNNSNFGYLILSKEKNN